METLKLTSIRLEKSSLKKASEISRCKQYYHLSDVLRLAIWAGLKIVNANNLYRIGRMQFDEEAHGARYELEDVLHASAQKKKGTT